jgi:hypothetical protein
MLNLLYGKRVKKLFSDYKKSNQKNPLIIRMSALEERLQQENNDNSKKLFILINEKLLDINDIENILESDEKDFILNKINNLKILFK